jgi:isocitrate/isopropylmalate dehydrogenase
MSNHVPITVAQGDGTGPEIMEAALHIIPKAGARIITTPQGRGYESLNVTASKMLGQVLEVVKTETPRTNNGTGGTLLRGQ